jgi:hypothetical protein
MMKREFSFFEETFSSGGFMYCLRYSDYDENKAVDLLTVLEQIDENKLELDEILKFVENIWRLPYLVACWQERISVDVKESISFKYFFHKLGELTDLKVSNMLKQIRVISRSQENL